MVTGKVKCPICGSTKTVELTNEAPVCDNDMMDMILIEAKGTK